MHWRHLEGQCWQVPELRYKPAEQFRQRVISEELQSEQVIKHPTHSFDVELRVNPLLHVKQFPSPSHSWQFFGQSEHEVPLELGYEPGGQAIQVIGPVHLIHPV